LLTKIAELDPRYVIIDTNISLLDGAVIELRGPVDGRPLQLGESVEGYPSRGALNAMLSTFGWRYDYFDWEHSGLLDRTQMLDYLRGKRVSVVVGCNRRDFSAEDRQRAVQMVLDTQRDRRTQWQTIMNVASQFGMTRPALHAWVRKAERTAALQADPSQARPLGNTPG
jgi:hypothetical protein